MRGRPGLLSTAFLLWFIGLSWVPAQETRPVASPQSEDKSASTDELVERGRVAYRNKDFVLSAKLLEAAVAKGASEPGVFYDAACSLALAGDKDKAFRFLTLAIQAGFRKTDHLRKDSDLNSLHDGISRIYQRTQIGFENCGMEPIGQELFQLGIATPRSPKGFTGGKKDSVNLMEAIKR